MEGKGLDSELESFRQQWISEVRTKKGEQSSQTHRSTADGPSTSTAPVTSTAPTSPRKSKVRPPSPSKARKQPPVIDEEDDFLHGRSFDEGPEPAGNTVDGSVRSPPEKELISALDHYEEAMEKEAQGNMGDSLKLYRKAYRLDTRVDRRYREKHFPQAPHPKQPASQHAPSTAPSSKAITAPADAASTAKDETPILLPIKDLIATFAGLQIEAAPPEIEGTPPSPCPISSLPGELLIHIMQDVAGLDVGDFARLSLVCKPFAYLVATEQRIWRQVSLGQQFGFTGMHYHWNKTVEWDSLKDEEQVQDDGTLVSLRELKEQRVNENITTTKSLIPDPYKTWKAMFRSRPRIRFNGCYISTVNYIRTGQASTNQATWGGAPIHIVTYYRYLRFYRDGTIISLLTTNEPSEIVHHMTRDLLHLHRDNSHAYLPSAVMQRAYKGRWRLSLGMDDASDGPGREDEQLQEGDLTVETEGVDPKYMFRMDLSLRTAGKAARNNKIVWRGFFSYNKLTDDWAEFTLKHDKAFFFSRVRSYGLGE